MEAFEKGESKLFRRIAWEDAASDMESIDVSGHNSMMNLVFIRDEAAERDAALWAQVRRLPPGCDLKHQPDGQWHVWFHARCTGTAAYDTPQDAIAAALRSPDASAGEAERDA